MTEKPKLTARKLQLLLTCFTVHHPERLGSAANPHATALLPFTTSLGGRDGAGLTSRAGTCMARLQDETQMCYAGHTWNDKNREAAVMNGRKDHDAEEAHDVHLVEDLQVNISTFAARELPCVE